MLQFPGSRWWKFDFHTHTPASEDFGKGAEQAKLKMIAPEDWLLSFMRAGIDCVAVTDHNSGEWIDRLRTALAALQATPHPEFRPLYLFPGVEITANGGVHVLAVFAPSAQNTDVAKLLGAVGCAAKNGANDVAASSSSVQVIGEIARLGAIPIVAHVDGHNGLFERRTVTSNGVDTKEFCMSGNTLGPLLDSTHLFAMEVCDPSAPMPPLYEQKRLNWARVLGSDAHHLAGVEGKRYPGSHFTWIKMGSPSLEGLRLALLDGNDFSIRRSDDHPVGVDPNKTPENWIESIEVREARFMGRGTPETFAFSPWLNALVGGRGTGKSTAVHFARAALARSDEVLRLDEKSEPRVAFERFMDIPKFRERGGGLTQQSEVSVVYFHEGKRFRTTWKADESVAVEEARTDGTWARASSQEVRERLPARIFSQGQILELAGRNSQALMEIIDQAIGAPALTARAADEKARFLTLRSKAREFGQKLAGRDRVRGQLDDVRHKLTKFEETQHASVLKEHQKRARQLREIESQSVAVEEIVAEISRLAARATIADPPEGLFQTADGTDATAAAALTSLSRTVRQSSVELEEVAVALRAARQAFRDATLAGALGDGAAGAKQAYETLVAELQKQGVQDPSEYGKLVQDRQRLETDEQELVALEGRRQEIEAEARESLRRLGENRRELSVKRRDFLNSTLATNRHVRMAVEPYGRDARAAEQSFREILGVTDERFDSDILVLDGEQRPSGGLVADLYRKLPEDDDSASCAAIEGGLEVVRNQLTKACRGEVSSFGGHFKNYLSKEHQKRPELLDHLLAWSPPDGLRVEYSRKGDGKEFQPITQGSPGQRAAALLAFFLAYGSEPIVLDQPEDDLDNHLIYDLVVQQLRESKRNRQVITVTHNPNIVVNGDAEMVHALDFKGGQCRVTTRGCLQEKEVRDEVCRVMEGGRIAFERRYRRLADGGRDV